MRQAITRQVTGLSREVAISLARRAVTAPYHAYIATTKEERRAAYRLRFRVFNLELQEGLDSAFSTGEDQDEFDAVCDHVIVEEWRTGNVVGTYRLQTGTNASCHLGYYSAREFDFTPYQFLRDKMVELGRACIHPDHRKYEVLVLLWRTVIRYARDHGGRYLIGCSSLSSQDAHVGSAMYHKLKSNLAPEHLRTLPTADYAFMLPEPDAKADPPKLLRTYLALGAAICGPPALDREFKTIDFLTLMDLNSLAPAIRSRLF
jgi:putative hemolysin